MDNSQISSNLVQSEVFVEDRLLNYKMKYDQNKCQRVNKMMKDLFKPKLISSCFYENKKASNIISSHLPIKSNKKHRTKTKKWLQKEKERLIKELKKSNKSISSSKNKNLKIFPSKSYKLFFNFISKYKKWTSFSKKPKDSHKDQIQHKKQFIGKYQQKNQ